MNIMNNWQPGDLKIVFKKDGFNIYPYSNGMEELEDLLHDFLLPYIPQNAKVIRIIWDLIVLEDYNKAFNLLEDLEERIGSCSEIVRLRTIIAMEKND